MKRPFRERWLIAVMYWAESGRRYEKAMDRLEELEGRRPLEMSEQAFKAYLLLRTMKPDAAHDLFLRVRDLVKDRPDPESQYLTRYAQYWLAMIRWDPFNARQESREALRIECKPRLKRQLWVGKWDDQYPLDAEFDAWMKANAPGEADLRKRASGDLVVF